MTTRIPRLSVHVVSSNLAAATERHVVFHDDVTGAGGQIALVRTPEGLRITVVDMTGGVELALNGAGTFVQEDGRWVWRGE